MIKKHLDEYRVMSDRKKSLYTWLFIVIAYMILPDVLSFNPIDDAVVAALATIIEGVDQLRLCFNRDT